LTAQLIRGVFHLDISFNCCSGASEYPCGVSSDSTRDAEGPGDCGSGVFIAEEVDGVGDEGSGDTIMVDVDTLVEAFF
jgi:hypothetical protein